LDIKPLVFFLVKRITPILPCSTELVRNSSFVGAATAAILIRVDKTIAAEVAPALAAMYGVLICACNMAANLIKDDSNGIFYDSSQNRLLLRMLNLRTNF
jgi:hypothetical protein